MRLEVDDGKYTLIWDEDGLRADRYGEPWRILLGDKLIFAMMHELIEARQTIEYLKSSR